MDWRHRAACLDEDPELFFPIGNTGPALQQIEDAKAVCRRCPVVDTCLTWALDTGQDAGVWGGLSEDARRAPPRRPAGPRRAGSPPLSRPPWHPPPPVAPGKTTVRAPTVWAATSPDPGRAHADRRSRSSTSSTT